MFSIHELHFVERQYIVKKKKKKKKKKKSYSPSASDQALESLGLRYGVRGFESRVPHLSLQSVHFRFSSKI